MATIDVKCRFCNQIDDVKKHGTGYWHHQRYRCQSCRKTFQIDYTYRACKPRIKEQIVDLAMNNAGIRDTARAFHISINAVVRALKKLSPRCVIILPLDKLKIVLLCEVDEMWSFVIGKKRENLTLRNRLKRLNRKTLGYSKSADMHDQIIGTFIERNDYL